MPRLTLDALELIDAIDRKGSFSAAADLLHKVPSTVSYSVARLEEDLQVTLFERNGPQIRITAAGRELLRQGRPLLQAAIDLERQVRRVASGWESRFTLGIDSLLCAEALLPWVQRFHQVAADTALRIREEALTGAWEALLDGQCDLVIAAGPGPAGGGYQVRPLASLAFWFCVAPFHPLARAPEPLDEDSVRAQTAVAVADSARNLALRTAGLLSGQNTLVVPHMRAKCAYQVEGLGVGHLPECLARPLVERGRLVRKRLVVERPPEPLQLAWRHGSQGHALDWWIAALQADGVITALLDASLAR